MKFRLEGYGLHVVQLLFWGLIIALTVATLAPKETVPLNTSGNLDKVFHALVYFVLALLAGASYPNRRRALTISIALSIFGIALEAGQIFSVNREPSIFDAFANMVGIGFGWWIWHTIPEGGSI